MRQKVKIAAEDWMPIIEDAIPLDQYMPMEIVVYQPQAATGSVYFPSFT